jgi:hypothetical protein
LRSSIAAALTLALLASGAAYLPQAIAAAPRAPGAPASAPAVAEPGFIANQGQLEAPPRYYARQPGGAVYFEPDAVVLDRAPRGDDPGLVVRVSFPQREAGATLQAGAPREARISSFIGNDPARWRSALPTFGEVRYGRIAPGADLVYRVENGRLKYDVRLAPGADLREVRLRYAGIRSLEVGPAGDLVLHSDAGDLRESAPVLFQESAGRRRPVPGGYRAIADAEVGFWARDYDPRLPLTIDPAMVWSSFLGGNADDFANRVIVDADGGLIVVGTTGSSNYPTTTGAYRRSLAGASDVFVSKLRSDGRSLLWSTYLGGSGADEAKSAALGADGYLCVCGRTGSVDFPVTARAFQRAYGGGATDAFVAKLAPGGRSLTFCTLLGGGADDYAVDLALDGTGRPTVAGVTGSGDFPTTPGVVRPTWTPSFFDGAEGFVARLDAAGSGLVFSTFLGGGSADGAAGIALDDGGRPLVVGNTKSGAFPTTAGALRQTLGGAKDGFVTYFNDDASAYLYSTYLGGGDLDVAIAVARDAGGNAYVTGYTTSADFPTTPGAPQSAYRGGGAYDGFLCRLTPAGDGFSLGYGTYLGGGAQDVPLALAAAPDGLACVTGYTSSTDFPVTAGALDASANGGDDAFVTAVAADGRSLWYSSYLGSPGTEGGYSVAVLGEGRAAVCGSTTDGSFPTTAGAYDRSHGSPGLLDGFIAVLDIGVPPSVDVAPAPPALLALAPPLPTPFVVQTLVRLTLGRPAPASVVVLDVRGRTVATIARGALSAGPHAWTWDGRDDDGAALAPGLYWIQAVAGGERRAHPVVRLR